MPKPEPPPNRIENEMECGHVLVCDHHVAIGLCSACEVPRKVVRVSTEGVRYKKARGL